MRINVAKVSDATISAIAIQNSLKKEVNMEKSQVKYRETRTNITLYLVFLRVLKLTRSKVKRTFILKPYFARLKTSADIGRLPESSAMMMEVTRRPRLRQEITEAGTRLREAAGEARLMAHTESWTSVVTNYSNYSTIRIVGTE